MFRVEIKDDEGDFLYLDLDEVVGVQTTTYEKRVDEEEEGEKEERVNLEIVMSYWMVHTLGYHSMEAAKKQYDFIKKGMR